MAGAMAVWLGWPETPPSSKVTTASMPWRATKEPTAAATAGALQSLSGPSRRRGSSTAATKRPRRTHRRLSAPLAGSPDAEEGDDEEKEDEDEEEVVP